MSQARIRLKAHIHILKRVKSSNRDSWVWRFARLNLSRVATLMILSGHVHQDLERFVKRTVSCLLLHPDTCNDVFDLLVLDKNGNETEISSTEQGAYLFYDPDMQTWIRSGKASRPFIKRYENHKSGSLLTTVDSRDSNFYRSYCGKHSDEEHHQHRIGWFESLNMFCAVGYRIRSNGTGGCFKCLESNWLLVLRQFAGTE